MATPVIGDIVQNTVGKVVERLTDKYLPLPANEKVREELKVEAKRIAVEEYKTAVLDLQGARELAAKEAQKTAPEWTSVLTVTNRPAWSFLMLVIFTWTIFAPYMGFPQIPLSSVHKDIMETVIIFYFGGRSVEKAAGIVWGR